MEVESVAAPSPPPRCESVTLNDISNEMNFTTLVYIMASVTFAPFPKHDLVCCAGRS